MKKISRTVVMLSFVSLFADVASELLYPIIPMYLKSIGMGAMYIGILEGLAELVAGLSKSFFGKWSDRMGVRMPFVWFGYLLSSSSKALTGLFLNPWWVLLMRSSDRLGKGVRTSSRDAILSMEATNETKGAVFGFHRALDTTGAFLGPIFALIFLHFYPGEYRKLFLYSLIPTFFVIYFLFQVKEKKTKGKIESTNLFWSSLKYWEVANPQYKKLLIFLTSFTLINSSDMFLIMRAREAIPSDVSVISLYIFYNMIYASTSYFFGNLSDRLGKKKIYTFGLVFFGLTYLLFALSDSLLGFICAFFFYGLFAACTEGIGKAWISLLCKKEDLGVAIGFQNSVQSITTMLASLIAGVLWSFWGSSCVFYFSAAGSFVLIFIIHSLNENEMLII